VPFSPLRQRDRGGKSGQRCHQVFQTEEKRIALQRNSWHLVLVTVRSHHVSDAVQRGHFSALQRVPSLLSWEEGGGGGGGCLEGVLLLRGRCTVGRWAVLWDCQTGRQPTHKTPRGQSLEVGAGRFQFCDSILRVQRRGLPQSCLGGKHQQQ